METVKTAVIVLLLMACLYGVYVVLNKPEAPPPSEEIAWHDRQAGDGLQIDFGTSSTTTSPPTTVPELPGPPAGFAGTDVPAAPTSSDLTPPPPPFVPAPSPGGDASSTTTEPVTLPGADTLPSEIPQVASESANPPTATPPAWPTIPSAESAPTPEPPSPVATPATPTEPSQSVSPAASLNGNGGPDGSSPAAATGNDAASAARDLPAMSAENASADPPSARRTGFARVMQSAQSKIDDGQWYEALFTLSLQCNSPDMSAEERTRLLDLLDPLAAKVVYSNEHLIEPAYEVRRGDTLASIAQRYNVPWQLLANVNHLDNPETLAPGTQLKVIPGPFRAEVDVNGKELTLFVGRLYAGRFPISVGNDPSPAAGEYRVNDKQPGHAYYASDGRTIPAEDPHNPYGQIWIDLGGDVCIHGSAGNTGDSGMGCISLSPTDANDLFGILSQGSSVVIRR
jgi:lipoprotein-anchoring transpeptidase ErfK/SrfK